MIGVRHEIRHGLRDCAMHSDGVPTFGPKSGPCFEA
jgi:hypothetical protein